MNQLNPRLWSWPLLELPNSLFFISLMPKALAKEPFITLASTTSTRNSGLCNSLQVHRENRHRCPCYRSGDGPAIRLAKAGDAFGSPSRIERLLSRADAGSNVSSNVQRLYIVGQNGSARVRGTNSVLLHCGL